MSSAFAAGDVDAESVERVGELQAAAADVGMVGRDQRDVGARSSTAVPAFVTGCRRRVTWPARISARARSRDGARPRSTTQLIEPNAWTMGLTRF